MEEPRGQELIDLYKQNYCIAADALVTEEMILRHWELEKHLTQELLNSSPESRWAVFEKCYTTLYGELNWLNHLTNSSKEDENFEDQYRGWISLIGPAPQKVYEVGSGRAQLINYLAGLGYECRATEITRERGQKWSAAVPNLTWAISDGIHLQKFEQENSYDVVISDQVIEHLHPDDLVEHLTGVLAILKPGGRYVFNTPHLYSGPSDISLVFRRPKAEGMHLKEYTFRELSRKLRQVGFRNVASRTPRKLLRLVPLFAHSFYLNYLMILEAILGIIPSHEKRRQTFRSAARRFYSMSEIILVGQK